MRFVFFGVGAIGGGMAATLSLAGHQVIGIGRGAQLEAIQASGLRLRAADRDEVARFPCVSAPDEIEFRDDDVIVLAMKTQDTKAALESLQRCGVRHQAILCAQNGVDNERLALRLFENVYSAVVMMPADFVTPGEIVLNGAPKYGVFNIGRYPRGIDERVEAIADVLNGAGFAAFGVPDVMPGKYGKLLMNLHNVLDAALGDDAGNCRLRESARFEGGKVLEAAGIAADEQFRHDDLMKIEPVAGYERVGSSSRQSLARKAGSIETDYLNGEIVLLGRLHGVPVPVNAFLCELGNRLVVEEIEPGSLSLEEVDAAYERFVGSPRVPA